MVQGRELTDFHVDGVFKILVADNSFSILFEDTEKGKNLLDKAHHFSVREKLFSMISYAGATGSRSNGINILGIFFEKPEEKKKLLETLYYLA